MITTFALLVLTYFLLWTVTRLAFAPVVALTLWRHQRRYTARARALVDRLAAPPLVSVVVPAYNEELTAVETVQSLIALEYETREIVVVNDGSEDGTLRVLREAFELVPAPVSFAQPLKTAPVRGLYRSIAVPALLVIDKENGGGKADAANAGINAASGTLVVVTDADTILAPEAMTRSVLPFLDDPQVIAVGGNVAIVNGSRVENGIITETRLPRSWLARFQILEYMRSFFLFRLVCGRLNSVVLISGAFGMFRRDALLAVGGYDATSIAEDMDITIRLQEHYRRERTPMRIAFDPNPLGWTQAPEDLVSLRSQRYRWRRGLMQVLWRHRRLIGNPRYGAVGLVALPYVAFFEGLGALIEIAGYAMAFAALVLGFREARPWQLVVGMALLTGVSATLLAILLNDLGTRRYTRGRDLGTLLVVVVFENFGYLQLNSVWSWVGTVQAMTGKSGWGVMKRQPFNTRMPPSGQGRSRSRPRG